MVSINKIRIFMVIAVFHPYIGGAEKQAEKLASELIKNNIDVTMITGRWSNLLKKHEELNGIKIVRNLTNFIPGGKGGLNTKISFFQPPPSNSGSRIKSVKVFFRKIFVRSCVYFYQISLLFYLLKQRNNYDIIHVHQVLYPAFISTVAARILKKPVIAKVGSSGFNSDIHQIKKLPEGRVQLRYILNNLSKLVCTSRKMKEEFLCEGIKKDKIVLIRNGVKTEDFKRSYKSCNDLVYLGRFIKSKDIITLIAAFAQIIKTNKDLRLTLIGDGPEKDNIISMIERSGLNDNIILTGMIDDPEEILRKSDIFIFPSLIEGLSNSLIEAMSSKLPCVVTNIPGNVEVIGDKDSGYDIQEGGFAESGYGILFNPSDIEGLVGSIKYLFKNQGIREKIGESAYLRIRSEFDIKRVADRYISLYEEVGRQ